jgi:hypothetical protein
MRYLSLKRGIFPSEMSVTETNENSISENHFILRI